VKSIVIAGALAQKPGRGGHTWVFLQYLLGFKKLGWDVLFIDSLGDGVAIDEHGAPAPAERSWNARYTAEVMRGVGLESSYAILHDGGTAALGLSRAEVVERVRRSRALINVMGFLKDEEILAAAPKRVFLDIDPGFGQMWQALGLDDIFRGHDAHVTIGEHVGKQGCVVPACGRTWLTTRQPVVLDYWPAMPVGAAMTGAMTSVASWRGAYGPIDYQGGAYKLRAHEFRRFASLPRETGRPFTIALDIHAADAADKALLDANGWTTIDPIVAAGDPWRYRQFVQQSGAELMVAKGMYVSTQSGWFSDRSICYLASGRPVLAQDTGIRDLLPIGKGLLTFTAPAEAAEGVRAIERDYRTHSLAARAIAQECFDSSTVLRTLTERLSLS
jgi:hypothetical protein